MPFFHNDPIYEIQYEKIDENKCKIIGLTSNTDKMFSVKIPEHDPSGREVVEIDSCAFENNEQIKTVEISETVKIIGISAFKGCKELTSITIPNSVKHIGVWAFAECSALDSITIPDGVKHIGAGAFQGCVFLNNIEISNSVTSVGDLAFYRCFNLTITYKGTMASWCEIEGINEWPFTVICNDGSIERNY